MHNKILTEIRNRLEQVHEPARYLIREQHTKPQPGDIWRLPCGIVIPSYSFYVYEIIDGSAKVFPIFPWPEYAGPQDILLAKEFTSLNLAVSFELQNQIAISVLSRYVVTVNPLIFEYISNAYQAFKQNIGKEQYAWGMEYIDEYDVRLKYHKRIQKHLEEETTKIIRKEVNSDQ